MEYTFWMCKEETAFFVVVVYACLKGILHFCYGMDWLVVDRDEPRVS
jgi:hypothetical protein